MSDGEKKSRPRHRAPAERPIIEMAPNIWCVGEQCIRPPTPATQQEFDAYWWAFYKEEPFLSMGEQQWRAVGTYFRDWAAAHSFSLTSLHRRRPKSSSSG